MDKVSRNFLRMQWVLSIITASVLIAFYVLVVDIHEVVHLMLCLLFIVLWVAGIAGSYRAVYITERKWELHISTSPSESLKILWTFWKPVRKMLNKKEV